jgi:hypothetical protein
MLNDSIRRNTAPPIVALPIAPWNGIVHFIESRRTNGILEGINHKVQLAKRRARGYRNIDNFIKRSISYAVSSSLLTHGISHRVN